jgi:hypothetical protein
MLPQIDGVAEPYSVKAYSSGVFDSLTSKKNLADRIIRMEKRAVILHLGDYDASGVTIYDSVAWDVTAFIEADRPHGMVSVEFEWIALTRVQVADYDLPMSPAKAGGHSKEWTGDTCRLEALPPDVIAGIVRRSIIDHLDMDSWRPTRAGRD